MNRIEGAIACIAISGAVLTAPAERILRSCNMATAPRSASAILCSIESRIIRHAPRQLDAHVRIPAAPVPPIAIAVVQKTMPISAAPQPNDCIRRIRLQAQLAKLARTQAQLQTVSARIESANLQKQLDRQVRTALRSQAWAQQLRLNIVQRKTAEAQMRALSVPSLEHTQPL